MSSYVFYHKKQNYKEHEQLNDVKYYGFDICQYDSFNILRHVYSFILVNT